MTPYPDSLPLDSINVIVTDIRNNAVVADRANFAKAAWELAGYGLKTSLGDPAPVAPVKMDGPPLTDAEVADHLEKLLTPDFAFTSGPAGAVQGLSDILASLPWQAILKWALTAIAAAL